MIIKCATATGYDVIRASDDWSFLSEDDADYEMEF